MLAGQPRAGLEEENQSPVCPGAPGVLGPKGSFLVPEEEEALG